MFHWLHFGFGLLGRSFLSFLVLCSLLSAQDREARLVQSWTLPTGSVIAYQHVAAIQPAREAPVVFLHGGPGAFTVDHESTSEAFFHALSNDHFDVYLYDQVGSGRSARLADPRQYSVDRAVADLEAIRQLLRAEKMILVGDSWGATLAASYMAEHPGRCAKVIFTSPGAIEDSAPAGDKVNETSATAQQVAVWTRDFESRHHRAMELIYRDPLAAHNLLPDNEADAEFDVLLRRLLPTLVCNRSVPATDDVRGMGWWANEMISHDLATRDQHTAARLRLDHTPALILRGGCDYMRREVARRYRSVLPNSTLLEVPKAGHWLIYDQPEVFTSAIRAFLLDRPLPLKPYTINGAPGN
jgi:proline iminopeptidase